jgi:AAA family ATP:ADP antiporter
MLCCFCIAAEYAITRPAGQSIFLSGFSAETLPYVWLWTIPLNLAIVTLYNRLIPLWGPLRVMGLSVCVIAGIKLMSVFLLPLFPKLIFFIFCWKDIYILLMFKQLWSMIHSTISTSKAKVLYGLIFSAGTFGSVAGSCVPGFFAEFFGSEKLFLLTLPLYTVLFFAYYQSYRVSGAIGFKETITPQAIRASEGFTMIAKNRYLLGVLLLVVVMQVSVALVEYKFNHEIQLAFPIKDIRTAYMGKIMGLINIVSLGLQVLGSYLLLNVLGLRGSHFLVPILLAAGAFGQFFSPGFAMIAFAFIFTKSIDLSLFGVLREMLFVPLSMDEKYRAKAIIDVFAYRTSKAVASFMLLGLQFWVGKQTFYLSTYLAIGVFCLWLVTIAFLFRKEPVTATR